jgi:phage shock protein PspC (stress-responsive transcriptional regulator)
MAATVRTVVAVELAPPPADAAPAPSPAPLRSDEPPDRILGGVAALIADRFDIDALWVRIAFVLLALVGGVGILVYGALWLAFVVGRDTDRRWARVAGGILLVLGLPLALTTGFRFWDGPLAVFALLAGLAVALWSPRRAAPTTSSASPPPAPATEVVATATPRRRVRRPPSILGRLTLGIAVVVAALGALIDQVNGGRLHPEQWLGSAAIVCGIGLLVGALAGRALWLIIPAAAFAGIGFVAGEAARIDLEPDALFGDEGVHVGSDTPGGSHRSEHVVIGTVYVSVDDAPSAPVTVDARAAIGAVRISAATDVSVEVQASVDNGDVEVGDVERPNGTFMLGREGTPDVVVLARVGRGEITVEPYRRIARPEPPDPPDPPVLGGERIVAEGVVLSRSGQLVLAGGESVIQLDGTVLTGSTEQRDGLTVIPTSLGDFQLLPGDLLLTPFGVVLELPTITPGG